MATQGLMEKLALEAMEVAMVSVHLSIKGLGPRPTIDDRGHVR